MLHGIDLKVSGSVLPGQHGNIAEDIPVNEELEDPMADSV